MVVSNVSKFEEVDEETYALLVRAQYVYNFRVVELLPTEEMFSTIATFKAFLLEEEKKRKQEEDKREVARKAAAIKRKLKKETEEKRILADLVKKHGVPNI